MRIKFFIVTDPRTAETQDSATKIAQMSDSVHRSRSWRFKQHHVIVSETASQAFRRH